MTQQQEYHQQPQQVSTTALVTINFKGPKTAGTPTIQAGVVSIRTLISRRTPVKEDTLVTGRMPTTARTMAKAGMRRRTNTSTTIK